MTHEFFWMIFNSYLSLFMKRENMRLSSEITWMLLFWWNHHPIEIWTQKLHGRLAIKKNLIWRKKCSIDMIMRMCSFTWPQKFHVPCVCAQIFSLRIHRSVPHSTFPNPPDFRNPNFNHQRKYGLRLVMTELVLVDLKVLKEACSSIERTGKIFKGVLKQSQQAKSTKRQINEYD